ALTVGISGLASHYCLANAFRWGDASVVVPLDFLRIPLIAVVGWWLYGERLDVFVFAGAALIITGILWNLRSEAARAVRPIELKTRPEGGCRAPTASGCEPPPRDATPRSICGIASGDAPHERGCESIPSDALGSQ